MMETQMMGVVLKWLPQTSARSGLLMCIVTNKNFYKSNILLGGSSQLVSES